MPIVLIFLCFFCMFGCVNAEKTQARFTAKKYYEISLQYKKEGKLSKALKTLEELKKHFSYDSYSLSASLLIADIHFERRDYVLAAGLYTQFQKIYPKTKSQYVHYQLGRSYFYQLPKSADKDLSVGELALQNFQPLLRKSSPYKKEAKKYVKKIQTLKSKKDFLAALFYSKKKWNPSAWKRLQILIKEYPESPFVPEALLLSYKLAKKMNKNPSSFKNRLLKEFPKSEQAKSL